MKRIAISLLLLVAATSPLFAEEAAPNAYTLGECIATSLRQSPSVLSAEQELRRAGGVVWETWSDIVSADLSAEYTYQEGPTTRSVLTSSEDFGVSLEASVPVFSGGRVVNGILSAYANRDIAREGYRKAVNDTIYEVKKTFGQILIDKELVRVRTEEVQFLEKNYETIKNKYDAGLASWFELLRSQVELANAQPPLMEAQDSLDGAANDLKKLLGIDVDDTLEIAGDLTFKPVDVGPEESMARALSRNPDLLIASLSEDVAKKSVNSVIGEYFPTVSVFGRYSYASDAVEVTFDDSRWESVAGVMVTMPITDLLGVSARLKQARAVYEQTKINNKDVQNGIKAEVKKAYKDLVRSRKVVQSQEENVRLAKEGLDIAEIQYENGINTYLELTDTRLALTQANLNYLNAVFGYLEAAARMERLTGGDPRLFGSGTGGEVAPDLVGK